MQIKCVNTILLFGSKKKQQQQKNGMKRKYERNREIKILLIRFSSYTIQDYFNN